MNNVNEVRIAEKVKFWQEQDQINKSLIPRVLKNHELITKVTENANGTNELILGLENKVNEFDKKADEVRYEVDCIYKHVDSYKENLNELDGNVSKVLSYFNSNQKKIEEVLTLSDALSDFDENFHNKINEYENIIEDLNEKLHTMNDLNKRKTLIRDVVFSILIVVSIVIGVIL